MSIIQSEDKLINEMITGAINQKVKELATHFELDVTELLGQVPKYEGPKLQDMLNAQTDYDEDECIYAECGRAIVEVLNLLCARHNININTKEENKLKWFGPGIRVYELLGKYTPPLLEEMREKEQKHHLQLVSSLDSIEIKSDEEFKVPSPIDRKFHYNNFDITKDFKTLSECKCCDRHQKDKPIAVEDGWICDRWNDTHLGDEGHECECDCRHLMRFMAREYNPVNIEEHLAEVDKENQKN
jgi:hypothetical protein